MRNSRDLKNESMLTMPTMVWMIIFFAIPTTIAICIAFKPSNTSGDLLGGWTLDNFKTIFSPIYMVVIWRTIWVSILSTAICLFFSIPVGYYMARLSEKWRNVILLLVIVPFWTNFLIRIFAWKLLLNPQGLFEKILFYLGLIQDDTILIYNIGAVILITIYTFLPFSILPIYAAAEKFDFKLLEAARDLGATRWEAFYRIFLPNISNGLKAGAAMVLIPCLGSYVIPDLVGGTNSLMIGNLIANQAFASRNISMAAAWSTILMAIIIFPFGVFICSNLVIRKTVFNKETKK